MKFAKSYSKCSNIVFVFRSASTDGGMQGEDEEGDEGLAESPVKGD